MQKYRNNFTLIELLLVLGIMGIIMSVGVSSLSRLNKSQAVTGAVRTIAGQISLARSYAVSRNRYVALILPSEVDSNFAPDSSFILRKTRICYVKKDITASPVEYNFDGWVEGQQWLKLPKGSLAIISTKNDLKLPTPPQAASNIKIVNKIKYTDDDGYAINNGVSPALIFSSSGALLGGESYITVFFGIYPFKLSVNRPATPVAARNERYELTEGQASGQNKGRRWWRLTVNQFTGRVMFDRFQLY